MSNKHHLPTFLSTCLSQQKCNKEKVITEMFLSNNNNNSYNLYCTYFTNTLSKYVSDLKKNRPTVTAHNTILL